ncbi:MAG: DEAD/DEAH box helicase [Melioribacteraceae bacterium]|nr:DEAD/DEAH box helicase [Melioribacteraceae bacterium]
MSFEKINLIKPIHKALLEEGYKVPTPIQKKAIPVVLEGRDLLGCAQTGTGKTAAFAVPILQLLSNEERTNKKKSDVHALIVTPTRELAIQIGESFDTYGKYTGLKNAVVFGGVSQKAQTDKLGRGIDILIATPGRLLDLINQQFISLKQIKLFVLDEADRMLDMGFINDVNKIIALLPKKRQSLFFSATMPPDIIKLANTILHEPVKIEVTPESPTVDLIEQSIYFVAKADKKKLLTYLLKNTEIASALVFTRTKHGADSVVRFLKKADILAEAIHGDKAQNARQRALSNFKNGDIRVLVATDIAARGIDIDELSHVINFDIPNIPETYVHRIGRTGRAGLGGIAISLCDQEERAYIKDINKLIRKHIPIVKSHPFLFDELTVIDTPKETPAKKSTPHRKGSRATDTSSTPHRKGVSNQKSGSRQSESPHKNSVHNNSERHDKSAEYKKGSRHENSPTFNSREKSRIQNENSHEKSKTRTHGSVSQVNNPARADERKPQKGAPRKGYLFNENPPIEQSQRYGAKKYGSRKNSSESGSSRRDESNKIWSGNDGQNNVRPNRDRDTRNESRTANAKRDGFKKDESTRNGSRADVPKRSGSNRNRVENGGSKSDAEKSGSRREVSKDDRSNKASGSSRKKPAHKSNIPPNVWTNR